ncbi:RagB/SusD family nutrient uptake outer membrane protein [Chitinophaga tropicalis]|uniref:RagB/SusD family nutrient uptake outer membrane protein n=1 Tax=Chitinophaga tropicalis TaxID=2683588 RepID=A0A7K1U2L2_9BACT|nr:RagB/SusD family nutrient uptake outer membrane protein [Chitinophaga tropicalis]MVT08540.1 RagB/SusD family nutrient uptake outer membrane protein [Chitinophaga tropicalis]
MTKQFIYNVVLAGAFTWGLASCTKDLDRTPITEATSASVYKDFSNYKGILAKLYAGFSTTGQVGPTGSADISGIDEGTSSYIRGYFQMQELPTDEAVIGWNDGTLQDFHQMDWTADDNFINAMFSRLFYQIAQCNEFIRQTTDEKLSGNGITGDNLTDAKYFRAEARFLRALTYYHAMDLFGNVPFVTDTNTVAYYYPNQISRADLFAYIEKELKEIDPLLMDARANEYGRADKACAWALLSRLYLNAKTYTGTERNTDAITYSLKVINAGYSLVPQYARMFMADNNATSRSELLLTANFDGTRTQTYGGTTYLVHAAVGGNMSAAAFGVNSGWGGLRTTSAFVDLFTDITGATDKRAMFHTSGQNREIADLATFTDGYAITKWTNKTSAGADGSNSTFVDTDYPLFRLAEMYLNYAEAVLRGGTGGDASTALSYINTLRERAYGNTSGNITAANLTLDFILDERGRELYWEGHRRTDLVRYGRFTGGTYLWPWKGGVAAGASVAAFRDIYPIPTSALVANPNLEQNDDY